MSVAPWITVLLQHTVFTKRLIYYKFTFVRYSVKQGTTRRPTSYLVHCVPFLWLREEHGSADGLVISLASVCCSDFCWGLLLLLLFLFFLLLKIVFPIASIRTWFPESVSATRISLLASSSSFIYFFPAIARYPQLSALFKLLCMTRHSCRNVVPVRYDVFYSDFKTDLKLRCECSIKFHLFENAQDVTRLTAVCCMLLPYNPYRLPQRYKRHVCGPYCSCKHRFLWISPIFGC
jgi:hypothetical protein